MRIKKVTSQQELDRVNAWYEPRTGQRITEPERYVFFEDGEGSIIAVVCTVDITLVCPYIETENAFLSHRVFCLLQAWADMDGGNKAIVSNVQAKTYPLLRKLSAEFPEGTRLFHLNK